MLLTNSQTDPIVEILRLAYRRGLSIREKLAEENYSAESTSSSKRMEEDEEQPTSAQRNRGKRS